MPFCLPFCSKRVFLLLGCSENRVPCAPPRPLSWPLVSATTRQQQQPWGELLCRKQQQAGGGGRLPRCGAHRSSPLPHHTARQRVCSFIRMLLHDLVVVFWASVASTLRGTLAQNAHRAQQLFSGAAHSQQCGCTESSSHLHVDGSREKTLSCCDGLEAGGSGRCCGAARLRQCGAAARRDAARCAAGRAAAAAAASMQCSGGARSLCASAAWHTEQQHSAPSAQQLLRLHFGPALHHS